MELTKEFQRLLGTFIAIIFCCTLLYIAYLQTNLCYKIFSFKPKQNETYICHTYMGKLGNCMFQYGSLYGIAKKYGYKLVVSERDRVAKVFKQLFTSRVSDKKRASICSKTQVYSTARASQFYDLKLRNDTNLTVSGYLSSWRYFRICVDDIKKQFVFHDHVAEKGNKILNKIKENVGSNVTVGIHVRRGDFVAGGRVCAPKSYFDAARKYFKRFYNNAVFIVSTNPDNSSRDWCVKNLVEGRNDTFLLPKQPELIDLHVFTMCDHMVMSVGTFSWWAAFLNNGIKIYYDFYTDTHPHIVKDDFIFPGWIGISIKP